MCPEQSPRKSAPCVDADLCNRSLQAYLSLCLVIGKSVYICKLAQSDKASPHELN